MFLAENCTNLKMFAAGNSTNLKMFVAERNGSSTYLQAHTQGRRMAKWTRRKYKTYILFGVSLYFL